MPHISIITVTYNAELLIERTMRSVFEQTYKHIEYIVVDGMSKDKTVELVREHGTRVSRLIVEKDTGIYDAMNKGLLAATGDYVLFLNAGDELFAPNTLENILNTGSKADVYYGNTAVVNEQGQILADRRLSPPMELNWRSLQMGMCVSHQSFIAKRSICPEYNLNYKISGDIDWTIRVLKQSQVVVNTQNYVSKFLEGGASAVRRRQGLKERWQIMVAHYGLFTTVVNHLRILLRFIWHKVSGKNMT